jgi:hypothetical protein
MTATALILYQCLLLGKRTYGKGTARGTMFVHFLGKSALETKAATAVVGNPSSSVVCATEDAC